MRWDVPVLLVKMGAYPVHHGGLAVARSLGRVGVPVFALTEGRITPLAVSRYVTPVGAPLDPLASDESNGAALRAVLRNIPGEPVALATDDEAAVWLAEEAPQGLILPEQQPALPRALADKLSLHALCDKHHIPSPRTLVPQTIEDLAEAASSLLFPVALKNRQAFARLSTPAVPQTEVVRDAAELLAWAQANFNPACPPLLQEFVPGDRAQKWSYQAYRSERLRVSFTGIKLRDYPVHRGEATWVESRSNPVVAAQGDLLLEALGYCGLADLDFVLDTRDGVYRLIDFNPRIGAISAMCATQDGLDLTRIAYLDLTGQSVVPGAQVDHRTLQVEPGDRAARAALGLVKPSAPDVTAYFAADDRRPDLVRWARRAAGRLRQLGLPEHGLG